jgi:hypothetical protein
VLRIHDRKESEVRFKKKKQEVPTFYVGTTDQLTRVEAIALVFQITEAVERNDFKRVINLIGLPLEMAEMMEFDELCQVSMVRMADIARRAGMNPPE